MDNRKIAVIGANGMLGSDFVGILRKRGIAHVALARPDIELLFPDNIERALNADPDIQTVINCAAYTKVDLAEVHRRTAYESNTTGPQNLADACRKKGIRLIHFSTDYVFDGTKPAPYLEPDACIPINFYGQTKYESETYLLNHVPDSLIFRVQWLYGQNGVHFMSAIQAKAAQSPDPLKIVNDQWGAPTWTRDIVTAVLDGLEKNIPGGLYHLTALGETNWYEYAKLCFETMTITNALIPIPSSEFPTLAKRPRNSRLSTQKLSGLGVQLPNWQESVRAFLNRP